jgi:hypothetical protein
MTHHSHDQIVRWCLHYRWTLTYLAFIGTLLLILQVWEMLR